jgi:hypothetical protein
MISTATTLIGLLALFLLGIKWAMDLIREWPRKSPMSSYFERQHSMRNSAESKLKYSAVPYPDENDRTR